VRGKNGFKPPLILSLLPEGEGILWMPRWALFTVPISNSGHTAASQNLVLRQLYVDGVAVYTPSCGCPMSKGACIPSSPPCLATPTGPGAVQPLILG